MRGTFGGILLVGNKERFWNFAKILDNFHWFKFFWWFSGWKNKHNKLLLFDPSIRKFDSQSLTHPPQINGRSALSLEGNFTFFGALNVWRFVDESFSGCVSRLMIGDAFPLKNPRASRLQHNGKIRFGSCPFDALCVWAGTGKPRCLGGDGGTPMFGRGRGKRRNIFNQIANWDI